MNSLVTRLALFACLSLMLFAFGCAAEPEIVEKIVEVSVVEKIEGEKETLVLTDDPGELVIYSGRSEKLVGPIIDQFARTTGIKVSVKYGKTGEIAATIMEEGSNTPADIFLAQDPGGLGAVANLGMFATIPTSLLDQVPDWAKSADGLWIGISGRARVVVYNNARVDPTELPETLEGFTHPDWKGRIGWAPTNGSFQAMVTAMRAVWGDERTSDWLLGIQANDPRIYPKNTPTVAATAAGEVDVGFVNHYYLYRFLAEEGDGFAARNHHLIGGGPGSIVLVAGAGIIEGSDNRDNAELFLDFMLGKVAQQYFAGQTYEYPLVDGVKVSRLLTPTTDINIPDIDMVDLEDLAGTQSLLRNLGITP